jgi:glycine/serine hydroxymethyltransferase
MTPGGMRIGTPALTTRGFKEAEFVQVADFIDRAVKIAKDCQAQTPAPGERHVVASVVPCCPVGMVTGQACQGRAGQDSGCDA